MPDWFYITIIGIMTLFMGFWMIAWPLLKKRITKRNISRQSEMLTRLKPGMKIILMGGIYGEFVKFDHQLANVLISEKTPIVLDRNSIIGIVNLKASKEKGKFIPTKKAEK